MKRKFRRLWMAIAVAYLLLLNGTTVFAADGDIYIKDTMMLKCSAAELFSSDALAAEVGFQNPEKYYYEWGGRLYLVVVANDKLNENQNVFPGNLKGMPSIPSPGGDLEIEDIY